MEAVKPHTQGRRVRVRVPFFFFSEVRFCSSSLGGSGACELNFNVRVSALNASGSLY